MNIFMEPNSFYGEIPVERLADTFSEFFSLALELRQQLGGKAYLLDHYLSRLFTAANEPLANDAPEDGLESVSDFYAICRAVCRPEQDIPHPFSKEGREFIQSHPLTFQEKETETSLYIALLANDYMRSSIEAYKQYLSGALDRVFDKAGFSDLYDSLCNLLGSEKPMEKLNLLFRERFLTTPAMSVFFKYLTSQLMEALSFRDIETSLMVFQLILEYDLLSEKGFTAYQDDLLD